MKKVILFFLSGVLSLSFLNAQNSKVNKNTPGTWKFEAPYAPEGYTSGTIVVGQEDKNYTATMSFTGSEYKLTGENVKADNDSITFSVYLEGQDIKVLLKVDDNTKMAGKAVYSEGEVPLTLNKSNEGSTLK
jgi:hypothetical protein